MEAEGLKLPFAASARADGSRKKKFRDPMVSTRGGRGCVFAGPTNCKADNL